MLTPRGPNAGPNGGPVEAPPQVTSDDTFCSPMLNQLNPENLILPKLHSRVLDNLHRQLLVIDKMHQVKQLLLLLCLHLF